MQSQPTRAATRSLSHDLRTHGAFAKLRPANNSARHAFHEAILYINEQTGPYHKQFVIIEDSSAVLDASEEYSSNSDTEYDTDIHGNGRDSPENTHLHGYFTLSLDILPHHSSWRIGKGSSKSAQGTRGVDILPVRPGQREAKKIAAVHAIVQFNVDSGALVLRAGSNKPVWYYLDNEEIKLQNMAQRVLSSPTNRFRVGDLEYTLTFEVSDMTTFVQDRNKYLKAIHKRDPPHPKIDPIPLPHHKKLGHAIIHNSLGFGSFGWVSVGVDSSTGQPLAVKELRIRREDYTKKLAQDEVAIARRFTKVRILLITSSSCISDNYFLETSWFVENHPDLV